MKRITIISALIFIVSFAWGDSKIVNDQFRLTVDGQPIYSQGGGIFLFDDPVTGASRYYWYGVKYAEAEEYLRNPSHTFEKTHFESVTCYSSDDLVNWTFEGDVLSKQEIEANLPAAWVGRLGVAYLPADSIYAMFVQHNDQVLVATSHAPTAPFSWSHRIDMKPMIGTHNTGDQTVFTDYDTGKSYLIYSYGKGRHRQYVSEIGMKDGKPDILDCHEVCSGESREGNCMFKHKGKYYMVASNIYGWDGSLTYYVASDSIYGPYLPVNDMQVMPGCEADYSHVSQTGFFVTINGSDNDLVVYCGDRWAEFAGNGLGYNQWFPLSFDDTVPVFNSLSSWHLDADTGNWRVADDNNYVKNGSFEADRRPVPNPVKPRQTHLTGWLTEIISGNEVRNEDSESPYLNYLNTETDRRTVSGEKSLNISDKRAFERVVSQEIESTPYVALPDGEYVMTATVRQSADFGTLTMFAESDGKRFEKNISLTPGEWLTVTLPDVNVGQGCVTIGFHAVGNADASAQIDDVTLCRKK